MKGLRCGTNIKFIPATGIDIVKMRYQCITCMHEFQSKSLEELRAEDYDANRKGPENGCSLEVLSTNGEEIDVDDLIDAPETSFTFPFKQLFENISNGTPTKFMPVSDVCIVNLRYQCITCMAEYRMKSLEELRTEDYLANRGRVQEKLLFDLPFQQQRPNSFEDASILVPKSHQVEGTPIRFCPPVGNDVTKMFGVERYVTTNYQCITCMREYCNKSLEELRLEDYNADKKSSALGTVLTGLSSKWQVISSNNTSSQFSSSRGFGSGSEFSPMFKVPDSCPSVTETATKFKPLRGLDTVTKSGIAYIINALYQCITLMKEHENKSLEELRWEYYASNRKSLSLNLNSTWPEQKNWNSLSQSYGKPDSSGLLSDSKEFSRYEVKPVFGTPVKFQAQVGSDVVLRDASWIVANSAYQCITLMPEYADKSFEELRIEDYIADRKGSLHSSGGCLLCSSLVSSIQNGAISQSIEERLAENSVTNGDETQVSGSSQLDSSQFLSKAGPFGDGRTTYDNTWEKKFQPHFKYSAVVSNPVISKAFEYLNIVGIGTYALNPKDSKSCITVECQGIPVIWVVHRIATGSYVKRNSGIPEGFQFCPPKVEIFHKDRLDSSPWSFEALISAKLECGGMVITQDEVDIMTKTAICVFEVLEKAWASQQYNLLDLKIEFGIDVKSGEIVVAGLLDDDSWHLKPSYKEEEGMFSMNFTRKVHGHVIVVIESISDMEYTQRITQLCLKLGVTCSLKLVSVSTGMDDVFHFIWKQEGKGVPVVVITVGKNSNLMASIIAGNNTIPVICCPAFSQPVDMWTPSQLPLGCCTVLKPDGAALCASQMLALNDHVLWSRLRTMRLNEWKSHVRQNRKLENGAQ